MGFNLKPPIFIIPEFISNKHKECAEKIGLVVGPFARTIASKLGIGFSCYLVQTPEGWEECQDQGSLGEQDGPYLMDNLGRRRIRFSEANLPWGPKSVVLRRFAVQMWHPDSGGYFWYVRKTIGGEGSIFRYGLGAHAVFQTSTTDFDSASHRRLCYEWLATNYPDWQNPLAYWDED